MLTVIMKKRNEAFRYGKKDEFNGYTYHGTNNGGGGVLLSALGTKSPETTIE
jgi:hypothetical protein